MLKKLLIAAAGILVSLPALADGGQWHHGRAWQHWKHHHHARPAVVVVPAPRVFYAPPAPVYYAPPPRVVYAPPAPVYYAPPPRVVYPAVPESSVSIRLHFPL
jgi:hypothetical protein